MSVKWLAVSFPSCWGPYAGSKKGLPSVVLAGSRFVDMFSNESSVILPSNSPAVSSAESEKSRHDLLIRSMNSASSRMYLGEEQ